MKRNGKIYCVELEPDICNARENDELGEIIRRKRDKGEVVDKLEKLHYDLLQEFRHEVNELEQ